MFVGIENLPTFSRFQGNGCNFCGESSSRLRGECLLLGGKREFVLLSTCDLEASCDLFDRHAHMDIVEGVPEPIQHHHVTHGDIAHLLAEAGFLNDMGGAAHRILTACEDKVRIAGLDGLRSHVNGLLSRAANHVEGRGGDIYRQSAAQRRLTGGILPRAASQNLANDDLIDGGGIDIGLL